MDMSLNKSRYLEDQKIAEYYSDSKDKYIKLLLNFRDYCCGLLTLFTVQLSLSEKV